MPMPIIARSPVKGDAGHRSNLPKVAGILLPALLLLPAAVAASRNGRPDILAGIAAVGLGNLRSCLRIGGPPLEGSLARRMNALSIVFFTLAMVLPCIVQFASPSGPGILSGVAEGMALACACCCLVMMLAASHVDALPVSG